jgi:hypothetical protein
MINVEGINEPIKGRAVWCLHCERAWPHPGTPQPFLDSACPNDECDGGMGDIWDYHQTAAETGWPKIPICGKRYPLYQEGAEG